MRMILGHSGLSRGKGSDEGDLINPWGVCVDKDGFMYVSSVIVGIIEFKYFDLIVFV